MHACATLPCPSSKSRASPPPSAAPASGSDDQDPQSAPPADDDSGVPGFIDAAAAILEGWEHGRRETAGAERPAPHEQGGAGYDKADAAKKPQRVTRRRRAPWQATRAPALRSRLSEVATLGPVERAAMPVSEQPPRPRARRMASLVVTTIWAAGLAQDLDLFAIRRIDRRVGAAVYLIDGNSRCRPEGSSSTSLEL